MGDWFGAMARMIGALARPRTRTVRISTGSRSVEATLVDLDDRLLDDVGLTRAGGLLPTEPPRSWALQRRGVGRQSGGAISKPAKSKPGETVQLTSVQAPRLVAVCQ